MKLTDTTTLLPLLLRILNLKFCSTAVKQMLILFYSQKVVA